MERRLIFQTYPFEVKLAVLTANPLTHVLAFAFLLCWSELEKRRKLLESQSAIINPRWQIRLDGINELIKRCIWNAKQPLLILSVIKPPISSKLSRTRISHPHRRRAIIDQRWIRMKIDWFSPYEMILMISTMRTSSASTLYPINSWWSTKWKIIESRWDKVFQGLRSS